MDTPAKLRGQFYSTHLTLRCPNYKQCKACTMCQSYNPHNPLCVICESYKPGGKHHTCSVQRIEGVILLEELTGNPMFSMNPNPQDVTVDVCETSFNPEKKELCDRLHKLINK